MIVNTSSIAGFTGIGSSIPYAASKAAVISLTKSLARVLGPEIRVNAVSPGFVPTRWNAGREDEHAGNAHVDLDKLRTSCSLGEKEKEFMYVAADRLGLTGRGYDRCLRVARTIADLGGREKVITADLAEAVQYRSLERLRVSPAV